MKWLLVDDESVNYGVLQHFVEHMFAHLSVELFFADSEEAAHEIIIKKKPDLLFVDIDIAGTSGIDFVARYTDAKFWVIFVTGYHEFAVEAFRQNAIDYLIKPILDDELTRAVDKYLQAKRARKATRDYKLLKETVKNFQEKQIPIPNQTGFDMVFYEQITRVESEGSYSVIYLGNKTMIASKNLKYFELRLPNNVFFRVHDSHIVNRYCIKKYVRGSGGYLIMKDDTMINVSKRRKQALLDALGYTIEIK